MADPLNALPLRQILFLIIASLLPSASALAEEPEAVSPALYEANALVRVRYNPQAKPLLDGAMPVIRERLMFMLQHRIKGRPAIEQLAKDLDFTSGWPHTADGELTVEGKIKFAALTADLIRAVNVTVEGDDGTERLIRVRVRHIEARLTPKIAERLVDNFIRNVRTEIDGELLERKKFLDGEVLRYRRKVSELESARLRFALAAGFGSGDDLVAEIERRRVAMAKTEEVLSQRVRKGAIAADQRDKLTELTKGRELSDALLIEFARLHAIIESSKRDAKELAQLKESQKAAEKNEITMRTDYALIARELHAAKVQLEYWDQKLRDMQVTLVGYLSEKTQMVEWVERPIIATKVRE